MNEKLFETNYDVTKKSKLMVFFQKYKIYIFFILFILIVSIISLTLYFELKDREKISLSENYIKAKILIENKKNDEAKKILKDIIATNDETYSTLSLFLIINGNLTLEKNELINFFNQLIENKKIDKEIRNLIVFKKALFQSNFSNEIDLLETVNPLIKSETLWKPHALLLLGDYYVFKKEYIKAKEFYFEILSTKNLQKEFYEKARQNLALVADD